jgi:hypothetical protein
VYFVECNVEYSSSTVSAVEYLRSFVTENSENSTEIKIRISAGNRCYFSLIKLLKSRAVARNTKVRIYRTIIRPVVTYVSETGVSQPMTREVFEHGRGKCRGKSMDQCMTMESGGSGQIKNLWRCIKN